MIDINSGPILFKTHKHQVKSKTLLVTSLLASTLLVSACGMGTFQWPFKFDKSSSEGQVSQQSTAPFSGHVSAPKKQIEPVPANEAIHWDNPSARGHAGVSLDKQISQIDTKLQQFEYHHPEMMFDEKLTNSKARLDRLEQSVIKMRQDFNALLPVITELMNDPYEYAADPLAKKPVSPAYKGPTSLSRNGRMGHSESLKGSISAHKKNSYSETKRSVVQKKTTNKTPRLAYEGPSKISDLRIGDHSNKTRIVLDVDGKATYRQDLDNDINLLVVELPNTAWGTKREWSGSKTKLAQSYSVQDMGDGGSRVIIQLKHSSKLIGHDMIKDQGNRARIYFDLYSSSVHR